MAETGAADAREQLAAASQQMMAARAEADSAVARLREAEVRRMPSGICTAAERIPSVKARGRLQADETMLLDHGTLLPTSSTAFSNFRNR